MPLVTRQPTGLPSWPVMLIAGAEKAGKSYSCALASASPMVSRTLWVSIGETDPDQYGAIPGANFEIVEHNGTLNDIARVLREVAALPATEPPTMLVVDSMTKLWDMVSDQAQAAANARASRNNKRTNDDAVIGPDLWNKAKAFWQRMVASIMAHHGPVLLTARLDVVSEIGPDGKPTKRKVDKIKTEKNLQYDVDCVVQMPERGTSIVTGVRSTFLQLDEPTIYPKFTVPGLWGQLGLERVAARTVSHGVHPEDGHPLSGTSDPQDAPQTRQADAGATQGHNAPEQGTQGQPEGTQQAAPPAAANDWEALYVDAKRNEHDLRQFHTYAMNNGAPQAIVSRAMNGLSWYADKRSREAQANGSAPQQQDTTQRLSAQDALDGMPEHEPAPAGVGYDR